MTTEGEGHDPSPTEVLRHFADIEAAEYRQLFAATGNGIFVWRAYSVYRRHGLPIPPDILGVLDTYASALETTSGAEDVARALGLSVRKGGAAGSAAARKIERGARIVRAYAVAKQAGMTGARAKQIAAEWNHTTVGNVATVLSRAGVTASRPTSRLSVDPNQFLTAHLRLR